MFKKLILVLAFVILLTTESFALSDTYVSGNTVSFNTTAQIITFNTVTNKIHLQNLSTTKDCYVDLICRDLNGKRGYAAISTSTVMLSRVGNATPNTVDIDFSTKNLGFISDNNNESSNKVHYFVTGDRGDF